MSSPQSTRNGILLMILAIVLFTTMDAIAKGMVARYPTPQVIWARFTGQVLVAILLLGRRTLPMMRTNHPWLHLIRSACQFGATACFFTSLGYIGLAEATALTDINPVLITLGAALFLGEPLGPRRIFGVLAALAGALIVIRPGSDVFSLAALLPLGAAICYSGNALLTRHIGPRETPWAALIYGALFGAVLLLPVLPFVWITPSLPDLGLFALMGCLGASAQLCLIRSFSMTEAATVAPFAYLGIVFSAIWSVVLYNQWPDFWTLVGALVIVLAGLYVWHRETAAARTLKPE